MTQHRQYAFGIQSLLASALMLALPTIASAQVGLFVNHQNFTSIGPNNGNLLVNTDADPALESYPITNTTWLNNIGNVDFDLSPDGTIVFIRAFGAALSQSCSGFNSPSQIYFYRLVQDNDAGGHLEEVYNEDRCINGPVPDHVGIYDFPGQPQHVAYVVESNAGMGTTQRMHLFDLNGLDARQVLMLNDDIDQPFLFAPAGTYALFKHGVGMQAGQQDFTLVDLCSGSRFGNELQLFNNLNPNMNITAEVVENPPSSGQLEVVISHPDIGATGQYREPYVPCGAVSGACCNGTTCTETLSVNCAGNFFAGQTCASNPCLPPMGACCIGTTQNCVQTFSTSCGGTFFANQPCTPNPCIPPQWTLTITKIGAGDGLVRSTQLAGIFCGNSCMADFDENLAVSLSAAPDPDAVFVGWGGDCAGTNPLTQVTMVGDQHCIAEFALREADLTLSAMDSIDPVIAGNPLNYTITAQNNGPDDTSSVVVTVNLPADYHYNSCVPSTGSCTFANGTITWNIFNLAIGATPTLSINGVADGIARGQLQLTADITSSDIDPNQANNSITETTNVDVQFDLTLTKVASFADIPQGGNIVYTMYIANSGPSAATGVMLDDTLPAGVTTLDGRGSTTMPTPVICNIGTVPGGRTVPAAIYVMVDPSVPVGTVLTNTATVTADSADINPLDNTATVDVTIVDPLGNIGVTSFTRLVDNTTVIPQNGQTFTSVGSPTIGPNGAIAFNGRGTGIDGTYRIDGGMVSRVMDTTQVVPGSPGARFQSFNGFPSIEGNDVAFIGFVPVYAGIYASLNGALTTVGRIALTPLPGSPGTFGNWSSAEINNGEVVFYATQVCGFEGVYKWRNGSLEAIADSNTPIPNGTGSFTLFNGCIGYGIGPSFKDETIAFVARGDNSQRGIYTDAGGLHSVADLNSADANGNPFESLGNPSTDRGLIAFAARAGGVARVYVRDCLGVHAIVDENTPMPGQSQNFGAAGGLFGPNIVQLDSGHIVFQGASADLSVSGWYCYYHGQVFPIQEAGDTLEGGQFFPLFSNRALNHDRLVFNNLGTGNQTALFAADFGEIVVTLGDMNCDGVVNMSDLPLFALALVDASAYATAQPACNINNGDMNQDGLVDGGDLAGFISSLVGP